jgi:hypothetical protein
MSENTKVKPSHLSRIAVVYVRQSSAAQVEHNRESTARQYALTQRAATLGWPADRVTVIDEDLGLSGATAHHRNGFARMAAEVALAHVGIILGLEVSRLARNNADWYRLLDLCSAFALTYIPRLRSCKLPDAFVISSLPSILSGGVTTQQGPIAPSALPDFITVGSEEARSRAGLRPPPKLHVRFCRMQLSR